MIFPGRRHKEEDKEELLCYVSLLGRRENEFDTALVLRLLFSTRTIGILRPRGVVIMVMKFSSPEGDRMRVFRVSDVKELEEHVTRNH